jgi:hypothetical protein
MNFLIAGIFAFIVGFLVWRSKRTTDPAEQACAIEIGALLKSDPDAQPQAIADIFVKHGIARPRCQSVGRMVMPQLRKNGLNPGDAMLTMGRVRAAYALVP